MAELRAMFMAIGVFLMFPNTFEIIEKHCYLK